MTASLGSPLEPSESALESDEKISSNPPASETSKSLFGLRRTRSNSNASGSDAGSNASSRNSSPMRPVTNSGAHTPTVAHTPVSLSSPRNVDCNSPNLTG